MLPLNSRRPVPLRRALVFAASTFLLSARGAGRPWRIGVLIGGTRRPETEAQADAFRSGLEAGALLQRPDVSLDVRWGGGDIRQIRLVAAAMQAERFDLYAVATATAVREVQRMVAGRPIVFWAVSDPVGNGFVTNAAQPGGNITGFALYPYEVGGKWLQLLKEAAPGSEHAYVLMSADNPNIAGWKRAMEADAARTRLKLTWPELRRPADVEVALRAASRAARTGVIALPDPFLTRPEIAALLTAFSGAVPIVTGMQNGAETGAVISYEVDQVDLARRAGTYAARILRGEKPGDLPVQAADKYRLVINRKVQQSLGIQLPETLLVRADRVIE